MKPINSFFCVTCIAAVSLLTNSCHRGPHTTKTADGYARFSWFEYKGNDTVYRNIDSMRYKYLNPILAGFYPDPSICRVGDDYYLVNSSFSYYPGIPIFQSKDLVNWTQIGYVLDRPSQLKLDSLRVSRGVFAPTIRYYNGKFYVINTIVGGIGNFYVTATNPAGPWSDPILLKIDAIDPSFFFDDNGKAYVINNGPPIGKPLYKGHRAIWIQEFDVKSGKLVGPRKVIVNGGDDISKKPIWIEGPHIFKKDNIYYLICAQGGTAENHSEVVFRSKHAMGPYVPFSGNPILTQRQLDPSRPNPITCTGHADFVKTQNGNWWAVFLGCQPYADNYYNTGRETFMLPVTWKNGWPIILSGNKTVPYAVKRPALPAQHEISFPLNGNFTYRDNFNDSTLAYYWNFLRTPREKWYKLKKGQLLIKARNQPIDKVTSQPSFIGRRQQHAYCSATTAMSFVTSKPGDKAGLIAFQNAHHYYFLGLVRTADGDRMEVEQGSPGNGGPITLKSEKPDCEPGDPIYLRITAEGARYTFYYATRKGMWNVLLENADGTLLSTAKAGGFVGTYLGMYVCAGK